MRDKAWVIAFVCLIGLICGQGILFYRHTHFMHRSIERVEKQIDQVKLEGSRREREVGSRIESMVSQQESILSRYEDRFLKIYQESKDHIKSQKMHDDVDNMYLMMISEYLYMAHYGRSFLSSPSLIKRSLLQIKEILLRIHNKEIVDVISNEVDRLILSLDREDNERSSDSLLSMIDEWLLNVQHWPLLSEFFEEKTAQALSQKLSVTEDSVLSRIIQYAKNHFSQLLLFKTLGDQDVVSLAVQDQILLKAYCRCLLLYMKFSILSHDMVAFHQYRKKLLDLLQQFFDGKSSGVKGALFAIRSWNVLDLRNQSFYLDDLRLFIDKTLDKVNQK